MKPRNSGMLDVGDDHTIYYEQHGTGQKQAVFLHGGPGGGIPPAKTIAKLFDLQRWTVTAFDQRGCGRSRPFLGLQNNTTWDLVADIEKLRGHVGVERWMVFGGSWGSTLALAYGSRHADRITSMIVRGVCLMEPWEFDWLYSSEGVARMRPEGWERFVAGSGLGKTRRQISATTMMKAYERRFRTRRTLRAAARAWSDWESSLSWLDTMQQKKQSNGGMSDPKAAALSVLEHHYFKHNAWIRSGQLLAAARHFRFPLTIVQGAYDLVCPAESAVALHKAVRHSKLVLTHAGHAASERPTAAALRRATDQFSA
jgi:proline iminopeptidase